MVKEKQITREQIASLLDFRLEPFEPDRRYLFWLVLTAVFVLSLPVALFVFFTTGVYLLATCLVSSSEYLMTNLAVWRFLAFLLPAAGAVMFALFMLRPFLFNKRRRVFVTTLDPNREGLLYTFVDSIAAAVGAPAPVQIEIDSRANASVTLVKSILGGFFGKRKLIIGLPIIASLRTNELAAVLAHEFGHLSQSTGVSLQLLIRAINDWFARIVDERDLIDRRLMEWGRERSIVTRGGVYFLKLVIWLVRQILALFMWLSEIASSYVMRQMEFEADLAGARLVGHGCYVSTSRKMMLLQLACAEAERELSESWEDRVLVDDFAGYVAYRLDLMGHQINALVDRMIDEERVSETSTHPPMKERILKVTRAEEKGSFDLSKPAIELINSYRSLSKVLSIEHYRHHMKLPATEDMLITVDELHQRQQGDHETAKVIQGFFKGRYYARRAWLDLDPVRYESLGDREVFERLVEAKRALDEYSEFSPKDWADVAQNDDQLWEAYSEDEYFQAGFGQKKETSPVLNVSMESIPALIVGLEKRREVLDQNLASFDNLLKEFFDLALSRTLQKSRKTDLNTVLPYVKAYQRTAKGYSQFIKLNESYLRLYRLMMMTAYFREETNEGDIPEKCWVRQDLISREATATLRSLRSILSDCPYPFEYQKGEISVADFLLGEKKAVENRSNQALEVCRHLWKRWPVFHSRLVATLCEFAEKEERYLSQIYGEGKRVIVLDEKRK